MALRFQLGKMHTHRILADKSTVANHILVQGMLVLKDHKVATDLPGYIYIRMVICLGG